MTIKFGLELEAFYGKECELPPKNAPTDGFPGLLEFRSEPHTDLYKCYGEIVGQLAQFDATNPLSANYDIARYKFPRAALGELRRRHHIKDMVDIQNLYGKNPRNLNGVTIASLQINLSNQLVGAYRDDKGFNHGPQYGLLDTAKIVKLLDAEFAQEIKDSGRQQGEYAIKDSVRLEYRSLPNTCFRKECNFVARVLKVLKDV